MGQHAPCRDGPTCSHRGATAKVSRPSCVGNARGIHCASRTVTAA
jgi:hypothetical protein